MNWKLAAVFLIGSVVGFSQCVSLVVNPSTGLLDCTGATSAPPSGAAGGDLTGTYPNPTVKASVSLTTPVIGVATGTSLALGGATLGGNALAVTGTSDFSARLLISGGSNRIYIGQDTGATTYNAIQLNGNTNPEAAGMGLSGGGDSNLYVNAPTGGNIQIRPNQGASQLTVASTGVTIPSLTSGRITSACTGGLLCDSAGFLVSDSGNIRALTVTGGSSQAGNPQFKILAGSGQAGGNLIAAAYQNDGTTVISTLQYNGVWNAAALTSTSSAFNVSSSGFAGGPSTVLSFGPSNYTSPDFNISRISANLGGVGTGAQGSTAGSLSMTNATMSGQAIVAAGSAGTPAIAGGGNQTGFYFPNSTSVSLSHGGVNTGTFASTLWSGPALTLTGVITDSANGALSAPAITGTGTWITGGDATTTKPYMLIQPTGTTSTGWSTNGTGLGVNAASGFTGNLIDMQIAGASQLRLSAASGLEMLSGFTASANSQMGSANYFGWNARTQLQSPANGRFLILSSNHAAAGLAATASGDVPACYSTTFEVTFGAVCGTSLRADKQNIIPLGSALNTVLAMRPVVFDWKKTGLHDMGFIADDMAALDPLLGAYYADGKLQNFKDRSVLAYTVKAVQEQNGLFVSQQAQINAQGAQIEALKAEIAKLQPGRIVF